MVQRSEYGTEVRIWYRGPNMVQRQVDGAEDWHCLAEGGWIRYGRESNLESGVGFLSTTMMCDLRT
jgi:hypothetical protein